MDRADAARAWPEVLHLADVDALEGLGELLAGASVDEYGVDVIVCRKVRARLVQRLEADGLDLERGPGREDAGVRTREPRHLARDRLCRPWLRLRYAGGQAKEAEDSEQA